MLVLKVVSAVGATVSAVLEFVCVRSIVVGLDLERNFVFAARGIAKSIFAAISYIIIICRIDLVVGDVDLRIKFRLCVAICFGPDVFLTKSPTVTNRSHWKMGGCRNYTSPVVSASAD